MGFYLKFRCKCGYETPDNLGEVMCVCHSCKEVFGDSLVVPFIHLGFIQSWKELFRNLKEETLICPSCHKGIIKQWDYSCPKCGNKDMESEVTGSFF